MSHQIIDLINNIKYKKQIISNLQDDINSIKSYDVYINLIEFIAKIDDYIPQQVQLKNLSDLNTLLNKVYSINDRIKNVEHSLLIYEKYQFDVSLSIRELIANSSDAYYTEGVERLPETNIINITLEPKKFIISDTGSGMNLHDIAFYLLSPDRSKNTNAIISTGKEGVTGKFGQGFFSIFNYLQNHNDYIELNTKQKNNEEYKLRFTKNKNDIVFSIKLGSKITNNGTIIEVSSSRINDINITDVIKKYFKYSYRSKILINGKDIGQQFVDDGICLTLRNKACRTSTLNTINGAHNIHITVNGVLVVSIKVPSGFNVYENIIFDFPSNSLLGADRSSISSFDKNKAKEFVQSILKYTIDHKDVKLLNSVYPLTQSEQFDLPYLDSIITSTQLIVPGFDEVGYISLVDSQPAELINKQLYKNVNQNKKYDVYYKCNTNDKRIFNIIAIDNNTNVYTSINTKTFLMYNIINEIIRNRISANDPLQYNLIKNEENANEEPTYETNEILYEQYMEYKKPDNVKYSINDHYTYIKKIIKKIDNSQHTDMLVEYLTRTFTKKYVPKKETVLFDKFNEFISCCKIILKVSHIVKPDQKMMYERLIIRIMYDVFTDSTMIYKNILLLEKIFTYVIVDLNDNLLESFPTLYFIYYGSQDTNDKKETQDEPLFKDYIDKSPTKENYYINVMYKYVGLNLYDHSRYNNTNWWSDIWSIRMEAYWEHAGFLYNEKYFDHADNVYRILEMYELITTSYVIPFFPPPITRHKDATAEVYIPEKYRNNPTQLFPNTNYKKWLEFLTCKLIDDKCEIYKINIIKTADLFIANNNNNREKYNSNTFNDAKKALGSLEDLWKFINIYELITEYSIPILYPLIYGTDKIVPIPVKQQNIYEFNMVNTYEDPIVKHMISADPAKNKAIYIKSIISQTQDPLMWVRELIKNSIEAKADNIQFNIIEDAYNASINVEIIDNGNGIHVSTDPKLDKLYAFYIPKTPTKEKTTDDINFGWGLFTSFRFFNEIIIESSDGDTRIGKVKIKKIIDEKTGDLKVEHGIIRDLNQLKFKGTKITGIHNITKSYKSSILTEIKIACMQYIGNSNNITFNFNGEPLNTTDSELSAENMIYANNDVMLYKIAHQGIYLNGKFQFGKETISKYLEWTSGIVSEKLRKMIYGISINVIGRYAQNANRSAFIDEVINTKIVDTIKQGLVTAFAHEFTVTPSFLKLSYDEYYEFRFPKENTTSTKTLVSTDLTEVEFNSIILSSKIHKDDSFYDIKNKIKTYLQATSILNKSGKYISDKKNKFEIDNFTDKFKDYPIELIKQFYVKISEQKSSVEYQREKIDIIKQENPNVQITPHSVKITEHTITDTLMFDKTRYIKLNNLVKTLCSEHLQISVELEFYIDYNSSLAQADTGQTNNTPRIIQINQATDFFKKIMNYETITKNVFTILLNTICHELVHTEEPEGSIVVETTTHDIGFMYKLQEKLEKFVNITENAFETYRNMME